jgi:hypothetical protein
MANISKIVESNLFESRFLDFWLNTNTARNKVFRIPVAVKKYIRLSVHSIALILKFKSNKKVSISEISGDTDH